MPWGGLLFNASMLKIQSIDGVGFYSMPQCLKYIKSAPCILPYQLPKCSLCAITMFAADCSGCKEKVWNSLYHRGNRALKIYIHKRKMCVPFSLQH